MRFEFPPRIPDLMIEEIPTFPDAMQARERPDAGEYSLRFKVFHSPCVLLPLMFNMVFTAVLIILSHCLSADADIVHRSWSGAPGRRAGWTADHDRKRTEGVVGVTYSGDAVFGSRSIHGLAKMMGVAVEMCYIAGLSCPRKKKEIMCMPAANTRVAKAEIAAAHQRYEQVTKQTFWRDHQKNVISYHPC